MLNAITLKLYERLGARYKLVLPVVALSSALVIGLIALSLLLNYFRVSEGHWLAAAAVGLGSILLGILLAVWRGRRHMEPIFAFWDRDGQVSDSERIAAWDAAANMPMRSFRANSLLVAAVSALPIVVFVALELGLSLPGALLLFASALIPVGYGTAVNYAIAELLMRPVVADIAAGLPDEFPFRANGLLIRKRMVLLFPLFTSFVGFTVASLMSHHGGLGRLGFGVVAAAVVGLAFSFELTVLLGRSVTAPISDLRQAMARIRAGELGARVPVLVADELGELSHDFNLMAKGLEEREEMREAFSTYIDADIVPLILSGAVPPTGVEVTVSVLFLDVRGFTSFAAEASAPEVVQALNGLFETVVPIITAHGGHIDKFLGDGVMAIFGAPDNYEDHADRALAAAIELVRTVNAVPDGLRVGIGLNTGTVVAGAIGGGGRLNFSVIGDAVNVAARVEAATRQTGDALLLTAAVRDALVRPVDLLARDRLELKGKPEPVEVYAVAGLPGWPADTGAGGHGQTGGTLAAVSRWALDVRAARTRQR